MAPKKAGENTKKAAGNAKKAEVAAQKAAQEDQVKAKGEAEDWAKGAKNSAKKEAAADKAAEAARKKAEKDRLLAEEEASLPSKPKGAGAKTAVKKTRGLDLSQLDTNDPPQSSTSLSATGIDNALDLLSLTTATGAGDKVDRHPERRFKAAYTQFEARRLDEMKDEKGLRRQQKIDQIRKEFEKSTENPFNQQLVGTYDMNKEEMKDLKEKKRGEVENRLANEN